MNSPDIATGLIAARMGSSRFAGKTLADVQGKPMLGRIVERMRASSYIGDIVVATTELEIDDELQAWCDDAGIQCFRGSSDDVLGRLRSAAEAFDAETILEVLGDNPLIHSDLIDAVLEQFWRKKNDYVATVTHEYPNADPTLNRFPIGIRPQVFSIDTLRRCEDLAKDPDNREHATSFIAQHPEIFDIGYIEASGQFADLHRPDLTFAVNHPENLDLIRVIFDRCYLIDANFSVSDACKAYDERPDIHSLMGDQVGGSV